jgi:hypothetical protein
MFRLQVRGEEELIDMARAVGRGTDHLRQHLGQAVRRAGQATLREVKRAIQHNRIRGFRTGGRPYRGPSTPKGLRRRIAAAVDLDLNVGTLSPRAQFMVHTSRVGAGRVPEYIESGVPWRHPVMGNRKAWASSQGEPFFEKTVERNRPLFEQRLDEATRRVARAIERDA